MALLQAFISLSLPTFRLKAQDALTGFICLLRMCLAFHQGYNKCSDSIIDSLCPFNKPLRVPLCKVLVCAGQMISIGGVTVWLPVSFMEAVIHNYKRSPHEWMCTSPLPFYRYIDMVHCNNACLLSGIYDRLQHTVEYCCRLNSYGREEED